ncbi:unnamed protein product [Cunninghamella echinulata]
MSDDEEYNQNFEQANSSVSATFPMKVSALRINSHVVINGRPCKVIKTSKDNNEVTIVGIDIFTGKKLDVTLSSTYDVHVPNVARNEYQLVNIDDGFLNLMTQDGTAKDDIKIPEGDIGKDIQDCFDCGKDILVTVISAMGEEQCISFKEAPKGY